MIKSGTITGRQVCMMLYEQGILDQDDEQYNGLKAGNVGAYDFMRSKIQSLEITPGQLGLEDVYKRQAEGTICNGPGRPVILPELLLQTIYHQIDDKL